MFIMERVLKKKFIIFQMYLVRMMIYLKNIFIYHFHSK
jgi:hypothetical protein